MPAMGKAQEKGTHTYKDKYNKCHLVSGTKAELPDTGVVQPSALAATTTVACHGRQFRLPPGPQTKLKRCFGESQVFSLLGPHAPG